jgi:hypothetical protein
MFARGFLCFYREPPLASRQNSPKSNDSLTYAPISRKSNDSPTYTKTGGWGMFPAPTFKYHLKCRRADISSFTEPSPAAASAKDGRLPAGASPEEGTLVPKTGGYPPMWSYQVFSMLAKGCRLMASGCLLSPFPASLTQKQGGGGLVIPMRKRAGMKASATTGNAETLTRSTGAEGG